MINYFSPTELYNKYKESLEPIGWTPRVLGVLLSSGMLSGHYNRSLKIAEIKEDSLKKAIEYRNKITLSGVVTLK